MVLRQLLATTLVIGHQMQLDYIYFFHGLGFVLLAGVCYALSRGQCARLPWTWLGAFAAAHGLNEWLEMLGIALGAGPALLYAGLCALVASFFFMFEFARRSIPRLDTVRVALLLYLPIVAFIGLCGLAFGPKGINAAARYSVCFPGGVLSAIVLIRMARTVSSETRPWLFSAGVILGLYAVLSGLVVSQVGFAPASVVNVDAFARVFGFPLQLPRGVLACLAAYSLWGYYHALCPTEAARGYGLRHTAVTAAVMVAVLVMGWFVTGIHTGRANVRLSSEMRDEALTAVANLSPGKVMRLSGDGRDANSRDYSDVRDALSRLERVTLEGSVGFKGVSILGVREGHLVCLAGSGAQWGADRRSPNGPIPNSLSAVDQILNGSKLYVPPATLKPGADSLMAYAAIRDPHTGITVGVLDIEVDAVEWSRAVARERLAGILAILVLSTIILASSVSQQNARSATERLSNSERKYRSLVEGSTSIIALFDDQRRFARVNEPGLRGLGVSWEDLSGRKFSEVWPEDHQSAAESAAVSAMSGEKRSFEADFETPDGRLSTYHVVLNPLLDSTERVVGFIGTMLDITERKRAEQALVESEARYRDLFENATDYMLTFDLTGALTSVNKATELAMGYRPAIGSSFTDLVAPECHELVHKMPARKLRGEKDESSYEVEAFASDGERRLIEVKSRLVCRNGGPVEIHVTGRDVTERRSAERELAFEALVNSAMADLSGAILSTCSLDDISVMLLTHAKSITNSAAGFVGYIDPKIDCLVMPTAGTDPLDRLHRLNTGLEANSTIRSRILANPHPFLWNDLSSLREPPRLPGDDTLIEKLVSMPTTLGDELVGQIVVGNPSGNYSERDLSCLERLSSLYAIAIKRHRTDNELRVQSSAVNSTGEQVIITDLQGKIVYVNPAFELETGYTYDEVVGQNPRILKSGKHGEEFYQKMWATIMAGETWHCEITNSRKDGAQVIEDMTITPVKDEHGVPEQFVAIKRNVTNMKVYEEQLDYLSYHDPLTGLPNRLLFSDRLTRRLSEARNEGKMLAVMFLDVDRFKLINDTLGHNMGDMLLKEIADRLHSCLRDVDTLARMGGDEFTIIVSNIVSIEGVVVVAERIVEALKEPFHIDDRELFVSVSVGISIYPSDGEDAETLVKNADTAMYRAKGGSQSNCQLFTEAFNTADLERMTLENGLRKATERNELLLHYQPLVDMETGRTLGAEALVRWRHPEYGLVSPGRFIPLAEETGLIVPISYWVLRTACAQNKAWQDQGHPRITVSVNLSARLLHQEGLVDRVSQILAETGLEPEYLDLELTESALMENADTAIRVLTELKNLGIRVSLDDFGTGYSSLSYLRKFPIDSVKIDQSFVKDITTNPDDAAIASAVVAMSHSLKLKVIAEGVETLEQLEFLRSLKCDEIQGYFISRPVPATELQQILEEPAIILRVDAFRRAA